MPTSRDLTFLLPPGKPTSVPDVPGGLGEKLDTLLAPYEPNADARQALMVAIISAVAGSKGWGALHITSNGGVVPSVGDFANPSHPLLVGNIFGLLSKAQQDGNITPRMNQEIFEHPEDPRVQAGNHVAEFLVKRTSGTYLVQVHCLQDDEGQDLPF